ESAGFRGHWLDLIADGDVRATIDAQAEARHQSPCRLPVAAAVVGGADTAGRDGAAAGAVIGGAEADADVRREALVGAKVVVQVCQDHLAPEIEVGADGAGAMHAGVGAPFVGDVVAPAGAGVLAA